MSINNDVAKSKIIMHYLFPPQIYIFHEYFYILHVLSLYLHSGITNLEPSKISYDLMIQSFRWQKLVVINRKHKPTYKISITMKSVSYLET